MNACHIRAKMMLPVRIVSMDSGVNVQRDLQEPDVTWTSPNVHHTRVKMVPSVLMLSVVIFACKALSALTRFLTKYDLIIITTLNFMDELQIFYRNCDLIFTVLHICRMSEPFTFLSQMIQM